MLGWSLVSFRVPEMGGIAFAIQAAGQAGKISPHTTAEQRFFFFLCRSQKERGTGMVAA